MKIKFLEDVNLGSETCFKGMQYDSEIIGKDKLEELENENKIKIIPEVSLVENVIGESLDKKDPIISIEKTRKSNKNGKRP